MNIIESARKELQLGLPVGSWWRLHWTLAGAAAGAGRHQKTSQHGAREAREEVDELGLGQGHQPQLNPDTWSIQVQ